MNQSRIIAPRIEMLSKFSMAVSRTSAPMMMAMGLALLATSPSWAGEVIDFRTARAAKSENKCAALFLTTGAAISSAEEMAIITQLEVKKTQEEPPAELKDQLKEFDKISRIPYPDLKLRYDKPSPLNPSSVGSMNWGFAADANAGFAESNKSVPLGLIPFAAKLAVNPNGKQVFFVAKRFATESEMAVLDRARQDLTDDPAAAPKIMGAAMGFLNPRVMEYEWAVEHATTSGLQAYDAKTGVLTGKMLLPYATKILFAERVSSANNPGQDLVAVGLDRSALSTKSSDYVMIYSSKLNRGIGWFRFPRLHSDTRLLSDVSISPNGKEMILAVKKSGHKIFFRQSLDNVQRAEGDPSFAVKPSDRDKNYRNPSPEEFSPRDDFNSARRGGLIYATYVGDQLMTVDESGGVRIHTSKWDSNGSELFKIQADVNSKVVITNDGKMLVSGPGSVVNSAKDAGAEMHVYGKDGNVIADLGLEALLQNIPNNSQAHLTDLQAITSNIQVTRMGVSSDFGNKIQATFENSYPLPDGGEYKRLTTILWVNMGSGFKVQKVWDSSEQLTAPLL